MESTASGELLLEGDGSTGGVDIGPQRRRDVRVDWEVVAQTAKYVSGEDERTGLGRGRDRSCFWGSVET